MRPAARILVVEGPGGGAAAAEEALRAAGAGLETRRVADGAGELAGALGERVDLVLVCCAAPGPREVRVMETVRARAGDVPCVVVASEPGERSAVDMMRAGAADYLLSDGLERLHVVVEREVRDARERAGRRAAEAAFSLLNDRLAGLMRAAGDLAIMVAGPDGVITDFSEGAQRMLGHRAEEVIGRADLTLPQDLEELSEQAARNGAGSPLEALLGRARRGEAETRECTYVRGDGTRFPVALTIAPVLDAEGRVTGFVGIARDISARRRRDEEQAALRRVATAVAAGPEPEALFALVAREAASMVGADVGGVARFESGVAVEVGRWRRDAAVTQRPEKVLPLDGETATARVFRTSAPARVEDLRAVIDVRSLAALGDPPAVRATLAVPVRVADRLWGALWVGAEESGAFSAEDEAGLARFADMAGLAAGSAEDRERIVGETVASIFQGRRDVGETLALVIESARRALGADRATCYVVDEDGQRVVEVHTTETDPARRAVLEASVGKPRGALPIWDLLMRSEDPTLIAEDASIDPRLPQRLVRRLGAGALVGMRLEHASVRSGGAPMLLGTLFISFRRPRSFSARERVAVESMAGMAAVALANARLRAASERRRSDLARDPLTGLANHRAFQERLLVEVDRALAEGRGLALALVDIDRFRRINEDHGHEAGDRVLLAVAERLRWMAREGDLVARVGGEELAWLMPGTAAMEAWQAADRAREAVATLTLPGIGPVTVSAGVSAIDQAGSAPQLVRLAEGALYWAKQHGRDVVFLYSPEVVEELSAEERAERLQRLQSLQSIRVLARAVDAKDPSTREHSERVAELAVTLAAALGWSPERLMRLREAGLVHDVGKIGIPDAILFKPARLSLDEYDEITRHASIGAEMVAEVLGSEQVAWVRGHHERWDGRGYPDGLAGERIPDGARILALADAWDVMTSERTYHEPLSSADALAECRRCAGSQFWSVAVDALAQAVAEGRVPGADAARALPADAPSTSPQGGDREPR